jgi:hypothetical protein
MSIRRDDFGQFDPLFLRFFPAGRKLDNNCVDTRWVHMDSLLGRAWGPNGASPSGSRGWFQTPSRSVGFTPVLGTKRGLRLLTILPFGEGGGAFVQTETLPNLALD